MENRVEFNVSNEVYAGFSNGHAPTGFQIRSPRADDIHGIDEVVRNCEPFLSSYRSYYYWMKIRYFGDTCAVAEMGGEIVGWCSMIRVSERKYFLHQLGIAPQARRRGLATALFLYLLRKLKRRHAAFEVEFTSDRRNNAILDLNRTIAEGAGMRLVRKPDPVQVVEESAEDLYAMTYPACAGDRSSALDDDGGLERGFPCGISLMLQRVRGFCRQSARLAGECSGAFAGFLLADRRPGLSIDCARTCLGHLSVGQKVRHSDEREREAK